MDNKSRTNFIEAFFRFLKTNPLFRYTLIGFFVYIIWVTFWMIYADILFKDCLLLDSHFPNRIKPSDFSVSYAASAFDSLVFFILVGSVLTVLTLRRPEEEKLATKVDFIFPGAEDRPRLSKYLQDQITSLACISPKTSRRIVIQDVLEINDPESGKSELAVKVLTKTYCLIENIHNNHEYATDKMAFGMTLDPIKIENGIHGEVHDISITKHIENSSEAYPEHQLNGTHQILAGNLKYYKTFALKLAKKQKAAYQTSSWMWQPINKGLSFNPPRFTELQCITIINETDYVMNLRVGIPNNGDVDINLQANQSHEFDVDACLPGEKVTINFSELIAPVKPEVKND
ncbi:hypothetical protein H5125_17365 [Shewanella sp. SR44-4]|uniref:hypothetical protein n=1 Tax=Shewanella sp. SR44-4 TaxID=2760935 RepID=UPI0015FED52B|nr:hypothetical protein [Shewanella sp. SR44-4]MBB1363912.1 hypothetical protein [Shewanella sp. SR44-4]